MHVYGWAIELAVCAICTGSGVFYIPCRFFWDCIIIAMLMFTVLALPVGIAFFSDDQMDTAWIAINIIVDIIFLADILVTLRTGRLSKKVPDKVTCY